MNVDDWSSRPRCQFKGSTDFLCQSMLQRLLLDSHQDHQAQCVQETRSRKESTHGPSLLLSARSLLKET